MSSNIGPNPYNQTNPNGHGRFTGDSNNAIQGAATDTVQGVQSSPIKTVASLGAGVGFGYGVDKFISNVTSGGVEGNGSKLSRLMDRIDKNKALEPISDGIKKCNDWFEGFKNYFNTKHSDIAHNFSSEEGYNRPSGLAQSFGKKQLVTDLEQLGKDRTELTGRYNNILLSKKPEAGFFDFLRKPDMDKQLAKIKNQLASNGNNAREIEQKIAIVGKEKAPGLSKALANSTIGLGNMIGIKKIASMGLINGLFVGLTIKSTIDAPKGEKTSTFMDDLLGNWVGGWLLMPLVAKAWNGVANVCVKSGMKGDQIVGNFGNKMLRGIGHFMNWGHGTSFSKAGGFGSKLFGGTGLNSKWLITGLPGGIMRIAVVGYLTNEIFGNPLKAISHVIFGKPTDPEVLEKQKEQQKQAMKNPQMANNQNPNIQSQQSQQPQQSPQSQSQQTQQSPQPSQSQPQPQQPEQQNPQQPQRTYIPSSSPNPELLHPKLNNKTALIIINR